MCVGRHQEEVDALRDPCPDVSARLTGMVSVSNETIANVLPTLRQDHRPGIQMVAARLEDGALPRRVAAQWQRLGRGHVHDARPDDQAVHQAE